MNMDYVSSDQHNWQDYYARTAQLPRPVATSPFLNQIPHEGRVLDFGAGSGRWSAAFFRDRPDLTIDMLDQHIDQASLIPENWHGQKIKSSFQEFIPTQSYDGIWAHATLFFMTKSEMEACFHKMALALKDNGIISFTLVEDCHAANVVKFHGYSEDYIINLLRNEPLELVDIRRYPHTTYGQNNIEIPTYYVTARKISES